MSSEKGGYAPSDMLALSLMDPRKVAYQKDGRQSFHAISPTSFATPILAAQLADKWVEVSREVPGSSTELATGLRHFLKHLGHQLHSVKGLASFDISHVRRRHLDSWESDLLKQLHENHTDTAYRHAVHFFALLDRIVDDEPHALHQEVTQRLEQRTRLTHTRNPGLPPFELKEVRRMRSFAHRDVYDALRGGELEGPGRDVLISLLVLLSLATGEPVEVLRQLSTARILATSDSQHDDATQGMTHQERLTWLAEHDAVEAYAVTYIKRRAGGKTYQAVYTRKNHAAHSGLTALLRLTGPIRRDADSDCLWVCIRANRQVQEPPWSQIRWSLRRWTIEKNLTVNEPIVWARIRKVVVAREAMRQGGNYLRRTHRHTPEIFFGHYTSCPVLRAKAGHLLLETIDKYFEAATSGPLVITIEAASLIAQGQQTPLLPGGTATQLLAGELDGPHTACRNPLDSPYEKPGEACQLSTTGTCFGCSNALITQDHLPAALLIAEISNPDRAADPRVWMKRWKPIHEFITEVVIPAFPASAIEAARTMVGTIPLDIGTANDMRGLES